MDFFLRPRESLLKARLAGCKILVVDDNKDSARSLATLLKLQGAEVQMAHDGPSAVEMALAMLPDVVLLDIGLPGLSGYDVCRTLREDASMRKALFIAQTGWGQHEDRRRSEEAGFDYHLVKPIDHAVLQRLLETGPPGQPSETVAAGPA